MLVGRCLVFPELAPAVDLKTTSRERWLALVEIWPIIFLVLGVIGSLMSGVVTPTEAGAAGAFLAYVIAFLQGRMTWHVFKASVMEAVDQHLAASVRRRRRHPADQVPGPVRPAVLPRQSDGRLGARSGAAR